LRYLCIALAALLTIARFRHHRLIAQQSTDDVHLQLMQHCCAIDRVAQISVLPWLLSIAQRYVSTAQISLHHHRPIEQHDTSIVRSRYSSGYYLR